MLWVVPRASADLGSAKVADLWESAANAKVLILLIVSGVMALVLWLGDVIKPGSFGRANLRDVKPFPSVVWLLGGLSVFLSLSMAVDFVADQEWLVGEGMLGLGRLRELAVSQALGYAIAAGLGWCLIYLMVRSAPNSGLGVAVPDLAVGLLCFVVAFPFVALSAALMQAAVTGLGGEKPAEIAHATLGLIVKNKGETWSWVLIAAVVIGAPVVEEMVFRAFLQSGLLRTTKSPVWAILITSTIFAALHLTPESFRTHAQGSAVVAWLLGADSGGGGGVPFYAVVPLFVLSVAIGIAYERTKRLGVAIVMHAAFNGLNVALAMGWIDV